MSDQKISIHALREEGDLDVDALFAVYDISIHALREEGDGLNLPERVRTAYFYPRPPRGGRQGILCGFNAKKLFLSTPSARRATTAIGYRLKCVENFYPRPPRGGRLVCRLISCNTPSISIHALREEGDKRTYNAIAETVKFLSTPSARRATPRPPATP